MGDTGWTVADTARFNSAPSSSSLNSKRSNITSSLKKAKKKDPTDEDDSPPDQSSSSHSRVRWSDNVLRRSKSEEDLDRLLDGLEELTETLPDLTNAIAIGCTSKREPGPIVPVRKRSKEEEVSPLATSSSGYSTNNNSLSQQASSVPSKNNNHSGSSNNSAGGVIVRSQSSSNSAHSRSKPPPEDDFDLESYLIGPNSDPRSNPNGPVFPSVRKTRQLLQTTRDPYAPPGGSSTVDGSQSPSTTVMRQPYHTLQDSKPFSYIHTNGGNMSRNMSRTSSRETLSNHQQGLESPSLLRRILSPQGGNNVSESDSRPMSPASSRVVPIGSEPAPRSVPISMMTSSSEPQNKTVTVNVSFTPSTSNNGFQQSNSLSSIAVTPQEVPINNNSAKFASAYSLEVSQAESDCEAALSWLEKQQMKLQGRRNVERRRLTKGGGLSPINPPKDDVIQELKSSLHVARSETTTNRTEDYASDLASNLYSETSSTRESSPHKMTTNNVYNVPLKVDSSFQQQTPPKPANRTIHTMASTSTSNGGPIYSNTNGYNNGMSHNQQSTNYKTTKTVTIGSNGVQPQPVQPAAVPTHIETNFYTSPSTTQHHIIQTSTPKQQLQPSMSYQPQQTQQQQQLSSSSSQNASLSRQKSDTSFDRMRPFISRRLRYDSESENEMMQDYMLRRQAGNNSNGLHGSNTSIESGLHWGGAGGYGSQPGSRPITPGFPSVPGTPYLNQSATTGRNGARYNHHQHHHNGHNLFQQRSHSPAGSLYQGGMGHDGSISSRRGSISSEPAEVSPMHVKLVKESHKFWYKPHITREEAIKLLEPRSPGTFVVRDSNSFPGAFGLALKVATPPSPSQTKSADTSNELVRHFLIEPTSKGVKLKGYNNEPVFASLSALVYQHTLTQLALPTRLVLPQSDLGMNNVRDSTDSKVSTGSQMAQLLQQGAACNVHYLFTLDTDTLTGPEAIKKTVTAALAARPKPTIVHFKVSAQGITLTDNARKLFFRKHHPTSAVTFCGVDPDDRRWSTKEHGSNRFFAFVARKHQGKGANQCHVFAEADPEQPAKAIVNFVNKVMLAGGGKMQGKERV